MYILSINDIVSGKFLTFHDNLRITQLALDSRKPVFGLETLFFAVRGKKFDGHDYILQLYERGVRSFVVDRPSFQVGKNLMDANVVHVESSILALQQIARAKRDLFYYPVIAITGSNAKTIVKEWLGELLGSTYSIVKSPKSFNSQIGVPLSVWEMSDRHNLAIFEAGISRKGEMQRLQEVIEPTIGLITNLGTAHDEGFSTRQEKLLEKLSLFKNSRIIFCCSDQTNVSQQILDCYPDKEVFSWSRTGKSANVNFSHYHADVWSYEYKERRELVSLINGTNAYLENIMHCISVLCYFGLGVEEIQNGVSKLSDLDHRLTLKKGKNGTYLIDDSYSNDLTGLRTALDMFSQNYQNKRRSAVLTDFSEVPCDQEGKFYQDLGVLLSQYHVDRLIGIGKEIKKVIPFYQKESQFFDSVEEVMERQNLFQDEVVLIKGGRAFGLERLSNQLELRSHETVLELDLDALVSNLNFYKSRLNSTTKLMVMVKASAYGSGSVEIANILQYHQIDYLGVAYVEEGIELRNNGIKTPILVMNPSINQLQLFDQYELEAEIFDLELLRELLNHHPNVGFHLKVNTGMNRLGFDLNQLTDILMVIHSVPKYSLKGVFSHLATADDMSFEDFTKKQFHDFLLFYNKISTTLNVKPLAHILNSAGILNYPDFQMDMVRLGIGLYGHESSLKFQDKLSCVSHLKSVISQVRNVNPEDSVGYGRRGQVLRPSRVAIVPIGYADGYRRAYGNGRAYMIVNGKKCPVIGNVCMDMTMIDITETEASIGDEVTVFGNGPSIQEMADWADTIPYEILTDIGKRVKRVFLSR